MGQRPKKKNHQKIGKYFALNDIKNTTYQNFGIQPKQRLERNL